MPLDGSYGCGPGTPVTPEHHAEAPKRMSSDRLKMRYYEGVRKFDNSHLVAINWQLRADLAQQMHDVAQTLADRGE